MEAGAGGGAAVAVVGGITVTGAAQHAAWQAKLLPPVEQVRPGLWSVPVPIPDSPLRYTLSYLLGGSDGQLVVLDPGMDSGDGWSALTAGLAAAGAAAADVTGIVVTHAHPDHHNMSGRLRAASGAWVAMHAAELDTLPSRQPVLPQHEHAAADLGWLAGCGVPTDVAMEITYTPQTISDMWTLVEPDRLLADGDLVDLAGRRLGVVWTPGHTPGHICLYDADHDLLLSGDHVLPRISPNVGMHAGEQEPPLADFLDSLRRVAGYGGAEILPAHEYRFAGVDARVSQLLEHHEARCAEIMSVVRERGVSTVWAITTLLSWSRGWDQVLGFMRRMALAETYAHVRYLVQRGDLRDTPGGGISATA
jgi:glyoxylase-like metal-dependent hydrolase (beta-lactamase superfamily II)